MKWGGDWSPMMWPIKPLQSYLQSHPLNLGSRFQLCSQFPASTVISYPFGYFSSSSVWGSFSTYVEVISILEHCDISPFPQERCYTTCLHRNNAYWDRDYYIAPCPLLSSPQEQAVVLLIIICHWVLCIYCNTGMTES